MPCLRTFLRATVVVVVGVVGTGCFLTTSFDGLSSSGAPVETPPTDSDSGPPRDAGPRDASKADVVAGDAGDDRPFCVREQGKGHLFCSDFSTGTPLDGVWSTTLSEGGGLIAVDPATKVFVSTTEDVATGVFSKGILIYKMSKTIAKATLAYDINVESCVLEVDGTTKGQATLASLGQGEDTNRWIVGMLLNTDGFIVNTTRCTPTCTGTSTALAGGLGIGKRARLSQTIDVTASKMTVSLDGVVALDAAPVTLVSGVSTNFAVNIGAANRGPAKACRVTYDNVTFDLE